MDIPDQLKQPVSARGAAYAALDGFLWDAASWDSAVERVLHLDCPDGTQQQLAAAAGRLLTERLLTEPAMVYEARRLLAAVGAAPPGSLADEDERPPAPRSRFVGRAEELARGAAARLRAGVRILCVTGPPGTGKTRLAEEIAAAAAAQAGAGPRLRVSLSSPGPALGDRQLATSPREALREILVALGVPPTDVPASQQKQLDRYASELAGKQPVVLLDGAVDESQVRPLLPREGLVVVTSRRNLTGLTDPAAEFLPLQPLKPYESRLLIHDCFREQGAEPDGDAVAAVQELSSGWPVPALLLSRWLARERAARQQSIASLAERVRAARRDAEAADRPAPAADDAVPGAVVAAVISLLGDDQQAVVRLLALLRLPSCDLRVVCVGTGLDHGRARAALAELAILGLVERQGSGESWHLPHPAADYACWHALAREQQPTAAVERLLSRVAAVYRWRAENLRSLICPTDGEPLPLRARAAAQWQADLDGFAALLRAAGVSVRPALAHGLALEFLGLVQAAGDQRDTGEYVPAIAQIARDASDHGLQAGVLLQHARAERQRGELAGAGVALAAAEAAADDDAGLLADIARERAELGPGSHGPAPAPVGPPERAGASRVEEMLSDEGSTPAAPIIFGAPACAP